MKPRNLISLALIVGILLTTASGMEPTYGNIMQQADVPAVFMIIGIVIGLVIVLVVLGVAYIFSDRELVKDSLRDILNFLRGNPSIFLIGFIMSIILLAVTIGIDLISPVPPSTYMYGTADPTEIMGDFVPIMAFALLSLVITMLISIYFTAVFYCFIENPKIEGAFSKALKFYFRLLILCMVLFLLAIFLVILMLIVLFVVVFIVVLIAGAAASISPMIGGILFAILIILLYIAAMLTFLAVMLRLAFAVPILIYENGGVVDSLRESWDRTQGALLSIFVVNIIAGMIYMVPSIIVLIILPQSVMGQYLYLFLIYLLIPISYVAGAMLYFNASGTTRADVQKETRGTAPEEPESVEQPPKPKLSKSEIPIHEPPKYVG